MPVKLSTILGLKEKAWRGLEGADARFFEHLKEKLKSDSLNDIERKILIDALDAFQNGEDHHRMAFKLSSKGSRKTDLIGGNRWIERKIMGYMHSILRNSGSKHGAAKAAMKKYGLDGYGKPHVDTLKNRYKEYQAEENGEAYLEAYARLFHGDPEND